MQTSIGWKGSANIVRTARYVWFGISIVLGLLIGLVLGNRLIPLPYENQPMSSLRDDYKADVVLMAAEAYQSDQNIQHASENHPAFGCRPAALPSRNRPWSKRERSIILNQMLK